VGQNQTKQFDLFRPDCFFTDGTALTVALADSILTKDYPSMMKAYYRCYPHADYGGFFHAWAQALESQPYNSWGNRGAMRISSVGFAFDTLDEVLLRATEYTAVTNNHAEGVKGAQATAAIFLAKTGSTNAGDARCSHGEDIKRYVATTFQYDLSRRLDDIRPTYEFNVSCQGPFPRPFCAS
jgi:ADP-ribosylglycohydrolase